ncbi:LytR/AlgR family response regulator transcription factor [Pseudoalteromonas xiamenensis]|nr:LytTR family DNA-binding domain-containing protein [Pseudoalteromonas xiamenensis]
MDIGDKKNTWFERLDQHQRFYGYMGLAIYLLINNSINASTQWMEFTRHGKPSISLWEPFVWEYSSALSTFCLMPLLFWLFRTFPPRFSHIRKQIVIHLVGTIIFSLGHIALMVLIRHLAYLWAGGQYDFGDWVREGWYEYRKDAWGYVSLFIVYHLVRFGFSRVKGEAVPITSEQAPDVNSVEPYPEHFLVRKLDKEFLVKVAEIEWLESSGNYVNLHSNGRVYPLRGTLSNVLQRLKAAGFSRIHRSYGVNHHAIESIQYQTSGDGEIKLKAGTHLPLSRRYKEEFKRSFS